MTRTWNRSAPWLSGFAALMFSSVCFAQLPPLEEAPAVAGAEAPVETALPSDAELETLQREANTPKPAGPKRIVELPADFAAPDKQTVIIPERPEWIDKEEADGEDFIVSVSSALQTHSKDCRASLDERLREAVEKYVRSHVGDDKVAYFIHFDLPEIRDRLLDEGTEFSDVITTSVGPMHQSHALLRFSPDFSRELDLKWAHICQTGRVVRTAGAAVGGLILLSMLFGYFRVDTATKGYYTRRLQMLLAFALVALIAGGVFYYRSAAQLIYRLTT
ncbi:MAG: hypothetical protein KDB14_06635 [Planctomycetales bacterium]|nr:hypothetical protein [Planctomycetales bacterium]